MNLNDKEAAVLRQLAAGCTRRETAGALHLSYGYVGNLIESLKRKLGARNTPHAIHLAWQQNFFYLKILTTIDARDSVLHMNGERDGSEA